MIEWCVVRLAREEVFARALSLPVESQLLEQSWRDGHISIFLALPLIDLDGHSFRVDVPDFELEPFGDSQPSRIESQDYSPVLDIGDTCHDPSHLVSRENDGECLVFDRMGYESLPSHVCR